MKKMSIEKLFITLNFCKQILSQMHHFKTVIFLLSKLLWFMTDIKFAIVSNHRNFESKRVHNFKTVTPRQIWLAEGRGSNRVFLRKSVVWFWFQVLLEKLIAAPPGWQSAISTKLTWVLSVCITSMWNTFKVPKGFCWQFFHFKMNSV